MIAEIVEGCVYQEPSSIYRKGFYVAVFLMGLGLGVSEAIGKHLNCSKFWNAASGKSAQSLVSSKIGMLFFYTPSLIACVSSFWVFPNGDFRFLMLKSALTLHFIKRDLEAARLGFWRALLCIAEGRWALLMVDLQLEGANLGQSFYCDCIAQQIATERSFFQRWWI